MHLLFALVATAIALTIYPNGVFDVPLSQLTLSKIAGLVSAAIFALYALKNLFQSFEEDGIWPWR